eukprot:Clim_evm104s134 gene=Clim_evmTU104s134
MLGSTLFTKRVCGSPAEATLSLLRRLAETGSWEDLTAIQDQSTLQFIALAAVAGGELELPETVGYDPSELDRELRSIVLESFASRESLGPGWQYQDDGTSVLPRAQSLLRGLYDNLQQEQLEHGEWPHGGDNLSRMYDPSQLDRELRSIVLESLASRESLGPGWQYQDDGTSVLPRAQSLLRGLYDNLQQEQLEHGEWPHGGDNLSRMYDPTQLDLELQSIMLESFASRESLGPGWQYQDDGTSVLPRAQSLLRGFYDNLHEEQREQEHHNSSTLYPPSPCSVRTHKNKNWREAQVINNILFKHGPSDLRKHRHVRNRSLNPQIRMTTHATRNATGTTVLKLRNAQKCGKPKHVTRYALAAKEKRKRNGRSKVEKLHSLGSRPSYLRGCDGNRDCEHVHPASPAPAVVVPVVHIIETEPASPRDHPATTAQATHDSDRPQASYFGLLSMAGAEAVSRHCKSKTSSIGDSDLKSPLSLITASSSAAMRFHPKDQTAAISGSGFTVGFDVKAWAQRMLSSNVKDASLRQGVSAGIITPRHKHGIISPREQGQEQTLEDLRSRLVNGSGGQVGLKL